MPLSSVVIFYNSEGTPIAGTVPVEDSDSPALTGCYCEEFRHGIYTIPKDYLYALLYGADFIRKHEPMIIVKQLDKMSIPLMKYLVKGTFLSKVEVRWFHYREQIGKIEEYFRMTLEQVRIHCIKYRLPDVKNLTFERYGHLEEIWLKYQKITWLYHKGHLIYTDIWNDAFDEFDQNNFSEIIESIDDITEMALIEPLKLKFTAGVFEKPENGFDFDQKATVKFTFESNRKPNYKENKVDAKLFAIYKGKTEDMRQINEGRLVNENNWSTEFKLVKPAGYEGGAVEYYVEIENQYTEIKYRSESIILGATEIVMKSMKWGSEYVTHNETVSLFAEFSGCKDIENATVEIFEYDHNGKDVFIDKIETNTKEGKLKTEWKFIYRGDTDGIITEKEAKSKGGKYKPPQYFFTVKIGNKKWGEKQESGLLMFKDWIEIELLDKNGIPIVNEPFELYLADGVKYSGKLDDKGFARVESVAPGPVYVNFINHPLIKIKE